jgi:hypothetical protein
MELHHRFHHGAQVNNLNAAVANHSAVARMSVDEILAKHAEMPDAVRTAIRNNGGGHANHTMFWTIMGGRGGDPGGELAAAIARDFGSLVEFRAQFERASGTLLGSGWAFVTVTREAASPRGRMPKGLSARQRMQRTLGTKRGRTIYAKRGVSVEPVFSQMKETARALDRSACAASARAGASGICSPPCTTCASCTGSLSGAGRRAVGWTKSRRGGPEMPDEGPPQAAPGADDAPIRPAAIVARQPFDRCIGRNGPAERQAARRLRRPRPPRRHDALSWADEGHTSKTESCAAGRSAAG